MFGRRREAKNPNSTSRLGARRPEERNVQKMPTSGQERQSQVMRYYGSKGRSSSSFESTLSSSRGSDDRAGRGKKDARSSSATRSSIGAGISRLFRWSGVFVIGIVLLASITLGSPTVGFDHTQSAELDRTAAKSIAAYEEGISQIMNKSISYKTKLSLRSRLVERDILDQYPEVQRADVIIPLLARSPHVVLHFDPVFMRIILGNNRQGVVSESGRFIYEGSAEATNSRFAGLASLSLPNITAVPGQEVLTGVEVALFRLLHSEFDGSEKDRPKLKSIEYDIAKRELKVRFEGVQYFAKLTPERDAREQVGALVASIREMGEGSGAPPIQEYIDVRVDGRVFIK